MNHNNNAYTIAQRGYTLVANNYALGFNAINSSIPCVHESRVHPWNNSMCENECLWAFFIKGESFYYAARTLQTMSELVLDHTFFGHVVRTERDRNMYVLTTNRV